MSKLAKTSFFTIHGLPPPRCEKLMRNESRSLTVTPDHDAEIKTEPCDTQVKTGDMYEDEPPDYHLDTRFLTPAAFRVFTEWLYSEPPASIKSKEQRQTLLRTYLLAIKYNALSLQNHIID